MGLSVAPGDVPVVPLEDADQVRAHKWAAIGGGEDGVHVVRVAGAIVEPDQRHRAHSETIFPRIQVRLEIPPFARVHVRHEQLRSETLIHHTPPFTALRVT